MLVHYMVRSKQGEWPTTRLDRLLEGWFTALFGPHRTFVTLTESCVAEYNRLLSLGMKPNQIMAQCERSLAMDAVLDLVVDPLWYRITL